MAHPISKTKESPEPFVYYVTFEDYLKPQSIKNSKTSKLLLQNHNPLQAPSMRLKLLEHPVLIAGRKSLWLRFKEKLHKILHLQPKKKTLKPQPNCQSYEKIARVATIWHNKTFNKSSKLTIGNIELPRFLAFLKARNDDGLCKRKSGFEIYCEMASIHGFINFVGASTWQRAFWFLVVLIAVIMSGFILLLSHLMNTNTPTILYAESTQYPTWSTPFPAVTICNLNRISKRKAENIAKKL